MSLADVVSSLRPTTTEAVKALAASFLETHKTALETSGATLQLAQLMTVYKSLIKTERRRLSFFERERIHNELHDSQCLILTLPTGSVPNSYETVVDGIYIHHHYTPIASSQPATETATPTT
ncbi:MAG: hypothetical protein Q7R56_00590 [Nanoarchaeota archaeon]|nr:hypothetical protein [Nanoarchaeota archaeon]